MNVTVFAPGPKPELGAGEKLLELGYTTRPLEEVEDHAMKVPPQEGFHTSYYKVSSHNCRHFCAHMCKFLGAAVFDKYKEVTRDYSCTGAHSG